MPRFMSQGIATLAGTLIYTRFISPAHTLDWPRALFIGGFVALVSHAWGRLKAHRARAAA